MDQAIINDIRLDLSGCAASSLSPALHTLAIVGSHPVGLNLVPWDDPDVDIMIFNEAPLKPEKYPRWDACLQLHGPDVYATENNWVNPLYWAWLQECHGKAIYMQDVDPRVPDSVRYPIEDVLALTPYKYLRSSPAYALALGIVLGYRTIMLFGSELTSNTEYSYQATNYAFWIGFAHGRGIDVKLMCWQAEFHQELYGYDGELQISPDFFKDRLEEHVKAYTTNRQALDRINGKLADAMLEARFQDVAALIPQLDGVAQVAGETHACMTEAQRYLERTSMISRQEYERTSAQAQIDGDKVRSLKDKESGKAEYVWNVWKQTGSNQALQQLRMFLKQMQDYAYQTGEHYGTFRENMTYMAEYDARLQAAGGVRALGR